MSTSVTTEHVPRRWAPLSTAEGRDVSAMYLAPQCGTKWGNSKDTSSSTRHPTSTATSFLQSRFQSYIFAGNEEHLRSATLKETRWDQKKRLKFQSSNTYWPTTSQSICQIIQPSVFLTKFFDSHEFSVYLLFSFFPSLEECFPNCSFLEWKH